MGAMVAETRCGGITFAKSEIMESKDLASAIKLYNQALEGFDINKWLREKRVAPWRLQVLALVAMDRVDCLRQTGQIERAKGSASVLAADLATALGEQDPLAMQAADQRDQMLYAPMSP